MRIFGVILAGGEGRRMGGADKALLLLAGRSLIARLIDRLGPQVERLAISANGDASRFLGLGLPVLPDALRPDQPRQGPLCGLLAALIWAGDCGADAVVTAPVDCPFLPADLVPKLCLAAEGGGVALAESGGALHPTCGLWPVRLAAPLAAFLGSGSKPRLRDFAAAHGMVAARFPDDGAFANLNTRDELLRAEILLRSGG